MRRINFPTNAHIGVDADSGVLHNLDTSTAKLHDARVWAALLHGAGTSVWAELPISRLTQTKDNVLRFHIWAAAEPEPR